MPDDDQALTPRERDLLRLFASLSPDWQAAVMCIVRAAAKRESVNQAELTKAKE